EKVKKIFLMMFILFIPSFFAGIRYGIGTDYNNYSDIFTAIHTGVGNNPTEIGYTILNAVVGKLGGNVQIVFFIMSFLTMLFTYLFLYEYKNSLSVGIGMIVFMIMLYNSSFNMVRQALAITISLYAMKFIDNYKPKHYSFFILLAMTFHAGAIVMLPLYIIYNWVLNKRKLYRIGMYIFYLIILLIYSVIVYFVCL